MAQKVLYHQDGRQPVEMLLIKKHKNGTADIGFPASSDSDSKEPLVKVHGCPLQDDPKHGCCTLLGDDKADLIKGLKAEIKKLEKAHSDAVKAASAKPDDAALKTAAADATATLDAAQTELKALEASAEN